MSACQALVSPSRLTVRSLRPCVAVQRGIFNPGLTLAGFSRLFYYDHPDIIANQRVRWQHFMKAAKNGRLLARPDVPPLWTPYKVYHPALVGRLQSSYEDVEYEMSEITKQQQALGTKILFLAGDGLALMRLNHILAAKPDIYLDASPCIIPIQGVVMHSNTLHRIYLHYSCNIFTAYCVCT